MDRRIGPPNRGDPADGERRNGAYGKGLREGEGFVATREGALRGRGKTAGNFFENGLRGEHAARRNARRGGRDGNRGGKRGRNGSRGGGGGRRSLGGGSGRAIGGLGGENGGNGLGKHGLKAVVDEGRGGALESVATHRLRFGSSENGVVELVVGEVERVARKNVGAGERVGEGIRGGELGLEGWREGREGVREGSREECWMDWKRGLEQEENASHLDQAWGETPGHRRR